MTEFSEEQDELASAYLDGEATDDERARVEDDPELLARVDALRKVRDALAAPAVGPSSSERDAAIRAAIGAAVGAATVVDLGAARARRRLRIASIAAAVLVVLGAAGLLIRSASSTSKTTSTAAAAGSSASSAERGAATQAGGGADGQLVPGTFSLSTRDALGTFTDRSALTDAARTQLHNRLSVDQTKQADSTAVAPSANSAAGGPTFSGAVPSCPVAGPSNSVAEVYAASANLDGHAVQIDVFSLTDDSLTLIVTDVSSCTQLFTQSV